MELAKRFNKTMAIGFAAIALAGVMAFGFTTQAAFATDAPQVGDTFETDDAIYKITKVDNVNECTYLKLTFKKHTKAKTAYVYGTRNYKGMTFRVTKIQKGAFKSKKKQLTKINIKSKYITAIPASGITGLSKLTTVTGAPGLKTIGKKAFSNNPKLKSFTITSKKLKSIKASAFAKDKKLTKIKIAKTTKLTKKGVKGSLKGSKVKTVDVKNSKVKKYKKFFTKKNAGKKATVK